MALDLFGPTVLAGGVTVRPSETRSFTATDTFFKDCSSADLDDGTEFDAAWFNEVTANLRSIARGNGQTGGGADVVTQDNGDDALLFKAIQHLIQRGQPSVGVDTGSANNIIVALSPTPAEYKAGMPICVKIAANNVGGVPTVINCNGLGNVNVIRKDGSIPYDSDLIANAMQEFVFDGINFQLQGVSGQPVLQRALDLYVNGSTGNDSNPGTLASPFATIQAAVDYAFSYGPGLHAVTIHVADGTYGAVAIGATGVTGPTLVITGNMTTPANVIVDGGTATNSFTVAGANNVTIQGVTVQNSAGAALHSGFFASGSGAKINTSTTRSNAVAGGAVFQASGGATININGTHTFAGNAQYLFYPVSAGQILIGVSVGSFTIAVAITVSGATLAAVDAGIFSLGGNVPTWVNPGNVTGRKFTVSNNGAADVSGAGDNYFPGTVAGQRVSGGVYA